MLQLVVIACAVQGQPITRSVDDLDIEHASTFKQLASWGGFRRHFKEEEDKEEDGETGAEMKPEKKPRTEPHAVDIVAPPADAHAYKQLLHEQLQAKRAEVLATQRKLESLSLEQKELEMLVTRTLP